MTPQIFIEERLKQLKELTPKSIPKQQLADEIFQMVMSKKFRKYSAKPELISHIKNAIRLNIKENQPINFTFPHGAYKLWRLTEAPLPDWAELFTAMYYTAWLKPICEIYPPGVWVDYFVDDLILPKIDNISIEEVKSYLQEYQKILDFLKQYQPKNFRMTITRFESLFTSRDDFEKKLETYVKKLSLSHPTFAEDQLQVVELNARPTPQQLKDPRWKEKIRLTHDAYISMKRDLGYYFQPTKVPIFNQPLGSGMFLAVGTTKTSIAKFWVGIGALKTTNDSYMEYILSPKQIASTKLKKEPISIPGLSGKNFHTMSVFS